MDLLISDLHLHEGQKNVPQLFFKFMTEIAPASNNLYVLGDLFEYWIGDDFRTELSDKVIQAFFQYSKLGKGLFFVRGNRDFLLADEFIKSTGGQLLPECSVQNIGETPTLIMHGDSLCTLDLDYQAFKQQVRNPQWQQVFLSQTLEQRINIARQMREQSQKNQLLKKGEEQNLQQNNRSQKTNSEIMDVTPDEVIKVLIGSQTQRLIHGHTHRQFYHHLSQSSLPQKHAERIVLGDWGETGSYCRCANGQCELVNFSL